MFSRSMLTKTLLNLGPTLIKHDSTFMSYIMSSIICTRYFLAISQSGSWLNMNLKVDFILLSSPLFFLESSQNQTRRQSWDSTQPWVFLLVLFLIFFILFWNLAHTLSLYFCVPQPLERREGQVNFVSLVNTFKMSSSRRVTWMEITQCTRRCSVTVAATCSEATRVTNCNKANTCWSVATSQRICQVSPRFCLFSSSHNAMIDALLPSFHIWRKRGS